MAGALPEHVGGYLGRKIRPEDARVAGDHHVPANRAIETRKLLDDAHRRFDVHLGTAEIARNPEAEEARVTQGLEQGLRQAALALAFVAVLLYQRCKIAQPVKPLID